MLRFNYDKYKGIIISVAFFLLLDASVLILNFYISFEIADDAVSVNLAGRQRMLSQRTVKSLFAIDHALVHAGDGAATDSAIAELQLSQALFDETLNAFVDGGQARGADGESVSLEAVDEPAARDALIAARQLWLPYRQQVVAVLQVASEDREHLRPVLADAIGYAQANNLQLLTLMNDLTVALERLAASKATRLRAIQTVGITLAVINFFVILFHFIGQLRESDRRIEAARRETMEILDTVKEGLFLLDRDLVIGNQFSRHLREILGQRRIAGVRFGDLLQDIASGRDLATAEKYIGLLFEDRIKETLVGSLNPLHELEVNIPAGNGSYITKYLSFDFTRVILESGIQHLLVTVTDISERVRLGRELEASRARSEQQIEMLTGILHVNPGLLHSFIDAAFACCNRINGLLKQPARTTRSLHEKIVSLFVEVHNFKGEAAALNLAIFEREAHEFEAALDKLRRREMLAGNDFLGLAVRLDKLIGYTQSIEELTNKLAELGRPDEVAMSSEQGSALARWRHLYDLADKVAQRQGKAVTLVTSGLAETPMPAETQQLISDICIQFVRNAIVHGIEMPGARLESQKPRCGRIDIRLAELRSGELELTINDDGRGFDYDAIRARALGSGRWSEQELEGCDNKRLLSLIFQPGFRTASEGGIDAGRGAGMEVIMRRVQAVRGRISVASRRGRYSRFVVILSAAGVAQAA